jgi:hypothetical protein
MASELLIYQSDNGDTRIEVRLENENVWLNKNQMAELYQCDRSSVSKHIKNIYETRELEENSTCANFAQVQQEGERVVQRDITIYNLDVIISVGYRVNSHRGTQFRIWATQRLREYLVKGFTMDDERLKSGNQMNYFDELVNRIRDIRSSERIFYQKVKDIYATSIDYDSKSEVTQKFFQTVQNKLHWAIHHHTAAELIAERADADKPNMGLLSIKAGRVRKTDILVAKNYLTEPELKGLNLLVEQYLAFAESQAFSQKPMYMKDWIKKLHDILTINEKEILLDAGKISHKVAESIAGKQYVKYQKKQIETDRILSIKELENELKSIPASKKRKP